MSDSDVTVPLEHPLVITLDGAEVPLVASLRAAVKLSERHHGMLPLIDRLNIGSLDAATDVLFYALNKKDAEREALREHVYNAGLAYLTPYLVRYVIALSNGGRSPAPIAAAAE